MADVKTYAGSCQCGAVTFEADMALEGVIACNCSRCRRLGWRLAFVPEASFRLTAGEPALRTYLFNTRHIHHQFCETCGIEGFARAEAPDGRAMVAVNVRCLDGVDAEALPVKHFDGASL